MSIKHAFTNPLPDQPGFGGTKPSDWNADHVGSPITVTDGTTSIPNVTQETLVGATVSPGGAGEAIVTVPQAANMGAIGSPSSNTAQDVAVTLNNLLAALKTAGLMAPDVP